MRAIAVLGVIAFHFKLGPLRAGGFAGVDVFFVISGFLMTRIVVSRLDRGAFSLADFLMARTRRIVPAFVVMIVGVLVLGFVLLDPLLYETLAERAAWTLPFLSNVLFARQGTYFVSPEQNWLLHTWSLAVEAQFYLAFPLVLILLRWAKMPRIVEAGCIGLAASVSFALVIWSLSIGGDARSLSFYMLYGRAWEFLAGGLCAYATIWLQSIEELRWRQALHYAGMAGILFAMLVFHNTTPWPSSATLLPVAGAALMLIAGHERPRWAEIAPTRKLGLWSYSVYLWHWPVAAGLAVFEFWTLPYRLLGCGLALFLGVSSYLLIEQRLTEFLWRAPPRVWRFGLSTFGLAFAFSLAGSRANGLDSVRYALRPAVLANLTEVHAAQRERYTHECDWLKHVSTFVEECRFGPGEATDVLVVGDSFAAQLTPRYKDTFKKVNFGLAFVTQPGCAPISNTRFADQTSTCDRWTEELYPYLLRSRVKRVVFIASWPYYVQGNLCLFDVPNCGRDLAPGVYEVELNKAYRRLAVLWKTLREKGKEIVVFNTIPLPGPRGDPLRLARRVAAGEQLTLLDFSAADFQHRYQAESRRLKASADYAGAILVDPTPSVCPEGRCPLAANGQIFYGDGAHLRGFAVKAKRFEIFDRYITPSASSLASRN